MKFGSVIYSFIAYVGNTANLCFFKFKTPTAVSTSEMDNAPSVFENVLHYIKVCSLIKTTGAWKLWLDYWKTELFWNHNNKILNIFLCQHQNKRFSVNKFGFITSYATLIKQLFMGSCYVISKCYALHFQNNMATFS